MIFWLSALAHATCGVSVCPMDRPEGPQSEPILEPRFEVASLRNGQREGSAARLDLRARYLHRTGVGAGLIAPFVYLQEGSNEAFGLASPVGFVQWSWLRTEAVRPTVGFQLELPVGDVSLAGDHVEILPYLGTHVATAGWMFDARVGAHVGTDRHDHAAPQTITETHDGEVHTHAIAAGPEPVRLWNGADLLNPHGHREIDLRVQAGPVVGEYAWVGLVVDGAHVMDAKSATRNPWTLGPMARYSPTERASITADLSVPITPDRRIDWRGGVSLALGLR